MTLLSGPLAHVNNEVRDVASKIAAKLYVIYGDRMENYFDNLKPAQIYVQSFVWCKN